MSLEKHWRSILALIFLLVFMYGLTGLDYVVHHDLYEYGLQPSLVWQNEYWRLYAVVWYLGVVTVLAISKSWRLTLPILVFVGSNGQDLFFFGYWGNMQFPTGDWTWMTQYSWFGAWTTQMQILYTIALSSLAVILIAIIGKYIDKIVILDLIKQKLVKSHH